MFRAARTGVRISPFLGLSCNTSIGVHIQMLKNFQLELVNSFAYNRVCCENHDSVHGCMFWYLGASAGTQSKQAVRSCCTFITCARKVHPWSAGGLQCSSHTHGMTVDPLMNNEREFPPLHQVHPSAGIPWMCFLPEIVEFIVYIIFNYH